MASLVASTSGAGAGAEVTASTDAALTLGDSSSFNCNSKVEVEGDDSNNARGFSSSGPASPTTVILPPSLHYSEDNELNRTHSQPLPSQQLTPKSEELWVGVGRKTTWLSTIRLQKSSRAAMLQMESLVLRNQNCHQHL